MNKVLHILAKTLSILLYPLWMPTYGMVLFCIVLTRYMTIHVTRFWLITCLGTFLFTAIIPILLIANEMRRKRVKDWYITDSQERFWPYLYTCVGFGLWTYMLYTLFPTLRFMFWIALGATVSLAVVTIVNRWWKISAHLTGWGGLIGGIAAYSLYYGIWPLGSLIGLSVVALLLMYARLYEDAHTPEQVVAGFLLGLTCTFVPNLIVYHV